MSDTPKNQPSSTNNSTINPNQPPPPTKEETPMTTSPTPTNPADVMFVCACGNWRRDACLNESFYKELDGKLYCILHYPGPEKKEDFQKALQRKLDDADFNFRGVWFPDGVSFSDITFSAVADFSSAQFSADASFIDARFSKDAHFNGARFSKDASFSRAQFSKVVGFVEAQFSAEAGFINAQFRAEAFFNDAQFSAKATFYDAQFSKNAIFSGAQFSAEAHFSGAQFSAEASFSGAQFGAEASFTYIQISAEAHFSGAQFRADADFNDVQFGAAAFFNDAQFSKSAYFHGAVFNATVSFERTRFSEEDSSHGDTAIRNDASISDGDVVETRPEAIKVDFVGASFKDGVSFERNTFAEQVFVSFAAATFEKPERAVFHTNLTPLRPHWFINIDSRKFTFIDVNWGLLDRRDALGKEIAALESSGHGGLSRLMGVTLRQLAVNAEENNRYEEAANFRYMAMEAKRLRERGWRNNTWDKISRFLLRGLDWLREQRLWRAISRFNLGWWYWLMSGYGERVARAFVVLFSIWLLFAVIYWRGDATWWQPKQSAGRAAQVSAPQQPSPVAVDAPTASAVAPLTFPEAVIYSAYVMSLQKPEPLPANKRAKALVLCEMILGPVQAALLALAIRRKFMR